MSRTKKIAGKPVMGEKSDSAPEKQKSWTVLSEAATITGILGCCILTAGLILSPLIVLEANSLWDQLDQDMAQFRVST